MKKQNLILANFLIIFFFINFSILNSEDLKFISGKATIIDGDTIIINDEKIRFGGIDAPETKQICYLNSNKVFCGKISSEKLKEIIAENIVNCIRERNKDKYGRIIAECFIKDESISSNMVKNGYAFDYARYSKKKICQIPRICKKK